MLLLCCLIGWKETSEGIVRGQPSAKGIFRRRLLGLAAAAAVAIALGGQRAGGQQNPPARDAATGLELYGNFETLGVVADVPAGRSAAEIALAKCYVRDGANLRQVHSLVQVGSQPWFATSIFFLKPGATYHVKVEFYDKSGKLIQELEGQGRTREELALPDAKAAVYVGPSGDDANPGTLDAPLRTLKAAFGRAEPGTTIWLRAGAYHEGGLAFPRSGSQDAPIVVRAYGKERAALDGADPSLLDPAGWKDEGDGVYSRAYAGTCFNASAQHTPSGKWTRLYPVESLDALRTRSYRKTTFERLHIEGAVFCDGTTAYVVLPGPREQYHIRLSAHGRGVLLEDREFIYFDGLEFRNYGKEVYGCAAFLLNASNILFQNCRFVHNNTGLWVKNASFNNTVQDCEFLDDTARWSFNMVKSGYDAHIETGAVYIEGRYSGRGMVIRRNRIAGLYDGAHLGPFIAIGGRTSETDFYQNRVSDVADDFVETDGYSRNVRIFDNFMDKSLSGVSLAQALDGPTFVLYNHILNCGDCTASRDEGYEGYPFKTNGGPRPDIGSGHVFFYHNTAWASAPNSHAILIKSGKWRQLTFRNNIWAARANGFVAWPRSPLSPLDFDYDNLHVERLAPLMRIAGNSYATLADVQGATPYLGHGFSHDPKFRDPAGGDFRLAPDSPLIDSGVIIPGINDQRFKGKAPDIGAAETR